MSRKKKEKALDECVLAAVERRIPEGQPILVGLSGGVDSVVLFRVLAEGGRNPVSALHLNHCLRGRDSDEDERFVKDLARKYERPIYATQIDVAEFARKGSLGIEEAARKVRMAFIDQIRERLGRPYLALGHHGNDRAETLLFNILRGAGVHGLASMREWDPERGLIRPLLSFTKECIVRFALEREWSWREDASNLDSRHDRNWLRNEILPRIGERKQGVVRVLMDTARRFEAMSDYVREQSEMWLVRNAGMSETGGDIVFEVRAFNQLHPFLKGEILRTLWHRAHGSPAGFNAALATRVQDWLARDPANGRVFFGKGREIRVRGKMASVAVARGCKLAPASEPEAAEEIARP